MTSAERVQEYLKRHKIGILFEDLMAKVIADMPDDPVIYLARILQLRAEKRATRSLKTSAHFDNVAVAKKSSDKPWSTNSKRLKDTDKTGKKVAKPQWDHRTKLATSSFDDLWDDPKALRKSQSGSPTKTASAWAEPGTDQDGEDVMFSVYGYRGPQRSHQDTTDPLAEELKLVKEKSHPKPSTNFSAVSKKSGRHVDSSQHKRALQQYIKEHEQKSDSGIEEDKDFQSDDAVELLENLDDLRREGVKNVKPSGVKVSRSCRQQPSVQAAVRVSICARCAKVMGAGVPSEPAAGGTFTEVTDYNYDSVKDAALSQAQSSHFQAAISDDDEEFESVSQVTGPRRPVWQDSDNEGTTPRKNKTILAFSSSPSKSLPVYSSDKSSRGQQKIGAPTAKSSQFHEHNGQNVASSPLHMTWSPSLPFNSSDSENKQYSTKAVATDTNQKEKDDDYTNQTARSQTARSGSAAWQVPPDYDTDSSFYGSPGASKPMRLDKAY